jgi:hypothetical protein
MYFSLKLWIIIIIIIKIIILPLMTKTFDSVGGVIRSFIIFEQ